MGQQSTIETTAIKQHSNKKIKILIYFTLFINLFVEGLPGTVSADEMRKTLAEESEQKKTRYRYQYIDRDHTVSEMFNDLAFCYGLTWVIYPIGQPEIFKGNDGSWNDYEDNIGDTVLDKDEPFWNLFVHPFMGSQLYLYNRAKGYSRWESFQMTFFSSMLFEFTVEIYSEPASLQDLYNTPVFGTILGVGLENVSLKMLNSENSFYRFCGHVINPSTLLWFYEGKVEITPVIGLNDFYGLNVSMVF